VHSWSCDEQLGAGITEFIHIAMPALDSRYDMHREKPPNVGMAVSLTGHLAANCYMCTEGLLSCCVR